jgi:hypothetical protein
MGLRNEGMVKPIGKLVKRAIAFAAFAALAVALVRAASAASSLGIAAFKTQAGRAVSDSLFGGLLLAGASLIAGRWFSAGWKAASHLLSKARVSGAGIL